MTGSAVADAPDSVVASLVSCARLHADEAASARRRWSRTRRNVAGDRGCVNTARFQKIQRWPGSPGTTGCPTGAAMASAHMRRS
jgi:hypothetical protein